MKRLWICVLFALCMVLAGCGEGQQEEQKTRPADIRQEVRSSKPETPVQPENAEAHAELEEAGFSDQYTGTWRAPDAPQWDMNISSADGSGYDIEITWSGDQRNTVWEAAGKFDEIWGGIAYVGAKYEEIVNEGEPVERVPVPEREEISGFIYIEEDGMLYWIDDFDHAGDELHFARG